MTTALERMGRAELMEHVAELEARNDVLEKNHAIMLDTLGHAQARGSELLDETRALRRTLLIRLDQRMTAWGAPAAIATEQVNILVDLLKVRWKGDAKYGTAEAHADLPLHVRVESDAIIHCRDSTSLALDLLRAKKKAAGNHSTWVDVLAEEVLELNLELLADSIDEDRVEAEAIDVANVALKMVEARRIRRARTEAK